jgi:hypothetical protein
MKLYKDGLLIPAVKAPLFREFFSGWWDIATSGFLKWRQLHNPLTPGSIAYSPEQFH